MPEDIGYPDTIEEAAEALMKLGRVDPMEWLSKLEAMGFKMEKSGAPMLEEGGGCGPPEEMPEDSLEDKDMDEDRDMSNEYPDKYPHEEPGGINLVIVRKRAAKKAMNAPKKGNHHDY